MNDGQLQFDLDDLFLPVHAKDWMCVPMDMGFEFTVIDERRECLECGRHAWHQPDDYVCVLCRG